MDEIKKLGIRFMAFKIDLKLGALIDLQPP